MLYYLSTAKLHRNRANLIQTLNTADSLYNLLNNKFTLYLSPHRLSTSHKARLEELGISSHLPIKFSSLLHSRWKSFYYIPFLFVHKKKFKDSRIFVRSLKLSIGLIKLNIPHIFEVHELNQLLEKDFLKQIKSGLLSGTILRLVAINKTLKKNLVDHGIEPNLIEVLPNGVNLRIFLNIPLIEKEKIKDPTIIHVGSLSPDRGLNIIKELIQRGYRCILAGELRGGSIPDNANYLGIVPAGEVPLLYKRSEISIIPYQPELNTVNSFCSLKLIESMAAGRIIIASDLPPIRDVVTDGKEAILVPPTDTSSWIESIERIKKDPSFGLYLAKNARKKSMDFDYKKRAQRILALFENTKQY